MDENACLKNGATIDLLNVDKFGDDEKCALNDRIKFLEKENVELKSLACNLKIEVNDLRNENMKIRSCSLELSDEIASLKNRIIELETSNTSLENQKISFVDEIKFLEHDVFDSNKLVKALKEKKVKSCE